MSKIVLGHDQTIGVPMTIKRDYLILIFLLIGLGVQSCCSSRCSAPQQQEQKTVKTEIPPALPPAPVSLAPGTARIVAVPVSFDRQVCVLKVEKVLGYGMATPPVAVGSEIRLELKPEQEQQQLDQFDAAFKQQSVLTLTLRSAAGKPGETEAQLWQIMSVDKAAAIKSQEE